MGLHPNVSALMRNPTILSATPSTPAPARARGPARARVALFDACQTVIVMRVVEGRTHSWLPLFATELALWLPWVVATPLIVELARRYPVIRGTTLRAVAVHLLTHNCALAQAIVSELFSSYEKMLWMLDQDSDTIEPLIAEKLKSV